MEDKGVALSNSATEIDGEIKHYINLLALVSPMRYPFHELGRPRMMKIFLVETFGCEKACCQ